MNIYSLETLAQSEHARLDRIQQMRSRSLWSKEIAKETGSVIEGWKRSGLEAYLG